LLYQPKGNVLDIRFLESLVAVVEGGSISAAARGQGLTATAVSQRIRTLEADFGADLLIRSGHAAVPTKACLNLLPRARDLIFEAAMLKRDFGKDALSGPFRIGAIETALSELIPSVVKTISDNAPDCQLSIKPGTSIQLYEMLENGQIDLAIMVIPPFAIPKAFCLDELAAQPYVLIQNIDNGPVTKDRLISEPIILYDRKSWGGAPAWKWVTEYANPQNIMCDLDGLRTIAAMVENGLGIALLPSWPELLDSKAKLSFIAPTPPISDRKIVLLGKAAEKHDPLCGLIRKCLLQH
jgi:DNA-binding transcriptional LysR family regulator